MEDQPLVNTHIAMEIIIFKFGKSTISMGHFQVRELLVIARG